MDQRARMGTPIGRPPKQWAALTPGKRQRLDQLDKIPEKVWPIFFCDHKQRCESTSFSVSESGDRHFVKFSSTVINSTRLKTLFMDFEKQFTSSILIA